RRVVDCVCLQRAGVFLSTRHIAVGLSRERRGNALRAMRTVAGALQRALTTLALSWPRDSGE
ncbi:MAG: hypothetical protein ACKOJF_27165, partial [Planctomycetaceae bacterium]